MPLTATEPEENSIGIIGIGNLLLSDEGFGVHVVKYMESHYKFPDTVNLLDAGTAGIYLAPFMESVNNLFVIDVVNIDDPPGSIHNYKDDEISAGLVSTHMTPHQLGILEILDICRLRGNAPKSVEFLCVVPESLDTGVTLSPVVEDKVAMVADTLVNRLRELDSSPTIISP